MTQFIEPRTRRSQAPSPSPLVRTVDLAKAFGPTQALRSCSFELLPGEVHAVIGENGSGKSTLVKVLSGVHRPDRGAVLLPDGGDRSPRSPRAANEAGIVPVFQEVLFVGPRSVLQNIWVGTDPIWRARLSRREKQAWATALLDELLGEAPPLDTPVEELSLSDRQACAIVRALVRQPRVLILDEATSALDVATRDRLFAIVSRLAREGAGVIFISHRMDEIEKIGDRITVMRSGQTVATVERGEASMRELVNLMTGTDHLAAEVVGQRDREEIGGVALKARGLCLRPDAVPFDVDVRAGELVGVAGLEGHGQDAFLHALRGAGAVAGEIRVVTAGGERVVRSVKAALDSGIAYVPRERGAEALFPSMSIRANFAASTLLEDASVGLLSQRRTERRFRTWVDRLGIKLGRSRDNIDTLSGGNQQKVVLARALAAHPKVLLLNDPTRGVDIGAKQDIYALLSSLAAQGLAVVMLSTEVDEQVELMDRVLVFREYELFAELPRADASPDALVHAFFGRVQEAR